MSASPAPRRFAPPAWAVLLAAVALAAFVSLGSWQLGRAREKRALVAEFAAGSPTGSGPAGAGHRAQSQ